MCNLDLSDRQAAALRSWLDEQAKAQERSNTEASERIEQFEALLDHVVERVRAEERERCATIAEQHAGPFGGVGRLKLADDIAAAIRGDTPHA
jgi:hypothetical protein